MISTLISLVLLAQTTIQSQAWTTPVAFHVQAEPVSIALDRLSKIVGEPLKVKSPLADDLIIVHTDSSTPQEIIDKIAWAEYGKWADIDNIKTLVSDRLTRAKADQARQAWMLSRLQAEFSKGPLWPEESYRTSWLKASSEFDAAKSSHDDQKQKKVVDEENLNHPARRLFINLSKQIGLDQIASIPYGQEIAFSNVHEANVRPLPAQLKEDLRTFAKEFSEYGDSPPQDEKTRSHSLSVRAENSTLNFDFLLRITHTLYGTILFDLMTNGPDDALMLTVFLSQRLFVLEDGMTRLTPPSDVSGQYRPSTDVVNRLRVLPSQSATIDQRMSSTQQMIDDENHGRPDLLFALSSDYFRHVSKESHRLVVALPEDDSRVAIHPWPTTNDQRAAWLTTPGDYETNTDSESWTIRPRSIAFGTTYQIPRRTLAKTLGEFPSTSNIDILNIANIVANLDVETINRLVARAYAVTGLDQSTGDTPECKALKAIGLLSDSSKKKLREQGSVQIGLKDLPGALREFILRELTEKGQHIVSKDNPADPLGLEEWINSNFEDQSVLVFGRTDPNTVTVDFSVSPLTGVAIDTDLGGTSAYFISDIKSVVQQYYPGLDPDHPLDAENRTAMLLPLTTAKVHIKLNKGQSVDWITFLTQNLETSAPFSLDNPPQAFKDEMAKLKKRKGG